MADKQTLKESYKNAGFALSGHGRRNIDVLMTALSSADRETESDMYGSGKVIEDFQEKMAKILGKESAVFFPSGTMAQQIALRIWCDEKRSPAVAYHPLAHLEIHEEDGLKELHHIQTFLLGEKDRMTQLKDIKKLENKVSCILLELPQREIGGQLPGFEALKEISDYCHSKEISLHLDGARLWESLPYYQKTPAEICALFDSVYVSFYKGLGGVAGAILAGPKDFTEKSKVWKRRYGGDLISLYPYVISADYCYEKRIGKMTGYCEHARKLAEAFNLCDRIRTVPLVPQTNMFHVYLDINEKEAETLLASLQVKTGIGFTGTVMTSSEGKTYFEVSAGDGLEHIPEDELKKAFQLLNVMMRTAE